MDIITRVVEPSATAPSSCHLMVRSSGRQTTSIDIPAAPGVGGAALPMAARYRQALGLRVVDRFEKGANGTGTGVVTHVSGFVATATADPQPRRLT